MLIGAHSTNIQYFMDRVVGLPRSTCAQFEAEAYGACITLVHFRAFPLAIRNDLHMVFMERGGLWGGKQRLQGGDVALRRDFYSRMISLRQQAYVFASFAAVTDDTVAMPYQPDNLVDNPWSLSDSEFYDGMVLLRYDKLPEVQAQGSDNGPSGLTSTGGGIVKDELLDFVSDFLKQSANTLRPVARGTVRAFGRASFLSAFLGALGDIAGARRLQRVKHRFQLDEPRRLFLKSAGWGDYIRPSAVAPPEMPRYQAPR